MRRAVLLARLCSRRLLRRPRFRERRRGPAPARPRSAPGARAHEAAILARARRPPRASQRRVRQARTSRGTPRRSRGASSRAASGRSSCASPDAPPVVYGELPAPGAKRTVVLYAHYDGQPVEPSRVDRRSLEARAARPSALADGGREMPWTGLAGAACSTRSARIYARSASDDKAPIVGAARGARRAEAAALPPLGQPEVLLRGRGGGRLAAPRRRCSTRNAARLCGRRLAPLRRSGPPDPPDAALLRGARRHGRRAHRLRPVAAAPQRALRQLGASTRSPSWPGSLATMRDDEGRILDCRASPTTCGRSTEAEKRAARRGAPRRRGRCAGASCSAGPRERASRCSTSSLLRPALNLRGIAGGAVGARGRPTRSRRRPTASIDFRLVPDQTPAQVRDAGRGARPPAGLHDRPRGPGRRRRGCRTRGSSGSTGGPGYPAARTSMDLPVSRAVIRVRRRGRRARRSCSCRRSAAAFRCTSSRRSSRPR